MLLAGMTGAARGEPASLTPPAYQLAMAEPVPRRASVDPTLDWIYSAQTAEGDAPSRHGSATIDLQGAIAVVYPDIAEPYRSVFTKIIEGIEETAKVGVRSVAVGSNVDTVQLAAQLKRSNVKVVIALGRQGLKAASALERDIPVVVGGVLLLPDAEHRNLVGISLTPDPALLFARLKSLQPGVKRVMVVYDPQHNEWLIRLAREAAKAQELDLVAHEARDLASAARLYEGLFASADGRRDALWLPQDPTTVDETTILPLVLKESWNRNVAVFSSSYLHVKKGALFVLYPNNAELGRNLATSALKLLSGESRKGILPLRQVYTAVNLRTASHIGLSLSHQQQRSFDSVFPEQ
jgi:putative ABC transport system substrate-binding protein